jgi:putative ABC transport system permease protein
MISIVSTLRIALRALWVNKMRSSLTMLGIIIGVGAVITMLAVGTGVSRKISAQISSIGSNLIMVVPGSSSQGGVRMGGGSQSTLTIGDAEAIMRECSAVATVAPIHRGAAQVIYGNQNWSTGVEGTTPGILEVKDCGLTAGRNMTDQDVRSAMKVCLLGQTVVDNLFGSIDPIGQIIRIKKIPFTVIGVLESKGQSLVGQDQDDIIYVPITTAQKRIFGTTIPGMVRTIMVKARSAEDLPIAERQVTDLLRQRHRIGAGKEDDFTVRNLTQMLQMAEDPASGGDCFHIASGRRHRYHEHHARFRNGKNPGNRHSHGRRGKNMGHPRSIHYRSADAGTDWRHHRNNLGNCSLHNFISSLRMADFCFAAVGSTLVWLFRHGGNIFWLLSGLQSLFA